ncbi:MAG: hypothetical protein AAGE93_12020 [Bacteroidota bacterium]
MSISLFKLVEENAFAYVARRLHPEILQLSFGNVSLQMAPREFNRLQSQIANTLNQIIVVRDPYLRDLTVSTSVKNMVFTFSYYELCQINQVMVNTQTILEVAEISEHPLSD